LLRSPEVTQSAPAASGAPGGLGAGRLRVPGVWRRRLAVTAITTGSVPMIMVGSGPPER
jgi:hypothetical protein